MKVLQIINILDLGISFYYFTIFSKVQCQMYANIGFKHKSLSISKLFMLSLVKVRLQ